MDEKLKCIAYFFPSFPQSEKVLEEVHQYILFLRLLHDSKKVLSWATFLDCIDEAFQIYEDANKSEDIFKILEVLYGYFPTDPDVNFKLALQLTRYDKYTESFSYARKAFLVYKNDPRVCSLYSSICNKLVSRWHFPMLNDRIRNSAYKGAITRAINAGVHSVIDIGAGTGLLSMYAKQAGCDNVYACEHNEFMCEVAKTIMDQNSSDVDILPYSSLELSVPEILPKRVSLAVTETFDCGLLGEDAIKSLKHALEHLISPLEEKFINDRSSEARQIIPSHAEVFVAAAESSYIAKQTKSVDCPYLNGKSLIYESDEPYTSENFRNRPGSFQLLSKWIPILNVDFNSRACLDDIIRGKKDIKIMLDVNAAGSLDCVILAFRLHLDDDYCISTFPENSSCWENAIYPMFSSKRLLLGDQICFNVGFTDGITICLKDCLFPCLSTRSVLDSGMLKCINSDNYIKYWEQAANEVSQLISDRGSVKILDTCPFAVAGLTVTKKNRNTKLFMMSAENVEIMKFLGHDVTLAEKEDTFDVIFFWPFKKFGECYEDPQICRWKNLVKPNAILYPNVVGSTLYGIESPFLVNASLVDDKNTCGIEVGKVFNKFKTQVQYEINPDSCLHSKLTTEMTIFTDKIEVGQETSETGFTLEHEGEYFLKTLHKLQKHKLNFTVRKTGKLAGFFRTYCLRYRNCDNKHLDGQTISNSDCRSESVSNENSFVFTNTEYDSPVDVSCHLLDDVLPVTQGDVLSLNVAMSGSDMCLYNVEKVIPKL